MPVIFSARFKQAAFLSATANLVHRAYSITEQQHTQIYILEFADIIQNANELVNGV